MKNTKKNQSVNPRILDSDIMVVRYDPDRKSLQDTMPHVFSHFSAQKDQGNVIFLNGGLDGLDNSRVLYPFPETRENWLRQLVYLLGGQFQDDAKAHDLWDWIDKNEEALNLTSPEGILVLYIIEPTGKVESAVTLLGLWQSLTLRYSFLNAKIFIPENIFRSCVGAYVDSSKLYGRSVELK